MDLGWLSPDGQFFMCHIMEHYATAQKLAKRYNNGEEVEHADDWLMQNGWVHITRSMLFGHEYFILHDKSFTNPQKEYLEPLIKQNWECIDRISQIEWKDEIGESE